MDKVPDKLPEYLLDDDPYMFTNEMVDGIHVAVDRYRGACSIFEILAALETVKLGYFHDTYYPRRCK